MSTSQLKMGVESTVETSYVSNIRQTMDNTQHTFREMKIQTQHPKQSLKLKIC
jgi:hypothetical protein